MSVSMILVQVTKVETATKKTISASTAFESFILVGPTMCSLGLTKLGVSLVDTLSYKN